MHVGKSNNAAGRDWEKSVVNEGDIIRAEYKRNQCRCWPLSGRLSPTNRISLYTQQQPKKGLLNSTHWVFVVSRGRNCLYLINFMFCCCSYWCSCLLPWICDIFLIVSPVKTLLVRSRLGNPFKKRSCNPSVAKPVNKILLRNGKPAASIPGLHPQGLFCFSGMEL